MASISGIYSSPVVKLRRSFFSSKLSRRDPSSVPITLAGRPACPAQSIARDIPASVSPVSDSPEMKAAASEKDPINLWHRYVDWLYQHKELGVYIDVSRIRFTNEFFEGMEPKMQKAFAAMRELEKGAIANPDEGRMVGHYWLRNAALAPKAILTSQIEKTLDAICSFADDIINAKIKPPSSPHGCFTQILSVGIGGSALGPQFVAEALAPDNPPLKIRFIDNTDPAGIDHQIAQLGPELASTLVIVISKGVAITQENSLLDNTARIEGWLARFPMFDWVGGRTSEMSAVGLLSAALQDMVVLPYKDSLLLFSRYLQQLVMESLGKEFDLDGNQIINILKNPSIIYQLREGVHNFFVTFIEVLRDRPPGHDWELEPGVTCGDYLFGMLQGTRSALFANDRESITVTVQEVNPRSIGALIALYERAVGIYASLININAYHQPGVEAGKKAAGEVLALQKRVLAILNEARLERIAFIVIGLIRSLECIFQLYIIYFRSEGFVKAALSSIGRGRFEEEWKGSKGDYYLNEEKCSPLNTRSAENRGYSALIEMIHKIIVHMAANDRAIIAEGNCRSPRSIKVFVGIEGPSIPIFHHFSPSSSAASSLLLPFLAACGLLLKNSGCGTAGFPGSSHRSRNKGLWSDCYSIVSKVRFRSFILAVL
ncbi:Glucose-6-phosphate isomerase 1, chloroplastic [Apostasia shenzhenica]|uniref:glucose-6-phosphate isomerase n=1 Tax=Apostasia shenzhenica TaxID=1088818 RepID=A0A2I0B2S3_9ASPA|nr:Glucose-6-phosphate isomerase 1, chloroplastic [Apostasia shenzhenica]